MVDIVLIVLASALILGVVLRQVKVEGYLILPSIKDGKFQLNSLFYVIIGFLFGIPVLEQIYAGISPTEPLSLLVGFGAVFTSIYGANTLIDAVGTYATPDLPESS